MAISQSAALASTADIVQEIRSEGFCVAPGVFSPSESEALCAILDGIVQDSAQKGSYFGSNSTQVIYNYFLHNERLYDLVAHPLIDEVMRSLIDNDYVLISPSARNPCYRNDLPQGKKVSGEGWHVDSRVADPKTGALYRPSMSYYAVVALQPFRRNNSATRYVPKSHLRYQKPLDREADIEHSVWEADAGSVIFFDSALWHRTGTPTETSRWSIFNMYGPWFMKPYFRFSENMTVEQQKRLPAVVQKLLHLNSTPPMNETSRTGTLTAEPVYAGR